MNLSVLSETQPGNIYPNSKHQSSQAGDFTAALEKTQNLTKDNLQTQQTIKNEQPTQPRAALDTKRYKYTAVEDEAVELNDMTLDATESTNNEAIELNDAAEILDLESATLITALPVSEIQKMQPVQAVAEMPIEIEMNILQVTALSSEIESEKINDDITLQEINTDASIEIVKQLEEDEMLEALPDAIVSSEVRQLQTIESPKIQTAEEAPVTLEKQPNSANHEDSIDQGTPVEAPQTKTTINEALKDNAPQSKNDNAEIKNPQVVELEATPQIMQQTAAGSGEAKLNNMRENQANSKTEISKELSSIVASVKVENTNSNENEIPMDLNGEPNENLPILVDSEEVQQDFKPAIDSGAKPTAILTKEDTIVEQSIDEVKEMHSVSNQIKTAVQKLNDGIAKSITITLTPESLGRVEIEVNVKAGNISTIEIKASRPETLQLLETNAKILQETLKEVSAGNNASLGFGFLGKGNDGNNQKQEAQAPSQEFSLLTPNSAETRHSEQRTLSGFSS